MQRGINKTAPPFSGEAAWGSNQSGLLRYYLPKP